MYKNIKIVKQGKYKVFMKRDNFLKFLHGHKVNISKVLKYNFIKKK